MKLVLVTPYFSTHGGGVEAVAAKIACGLVNQHAYEVEWFSSDCDPLPGSLPANILLRPVLSWNGIERLSGLPYPLWGISSCAGLAKAIRNADVVHVHELAYPSSLLALALAKIYKVPVLLTQHTGIVRGMGMLIGSLYRAYSFLAARLAFKTSRHVAFISATSRDHYAPLLPSEQRVSTIFNGVDIDAQSVAFAARMPAEMLARRNAIRADLDLPPVGERAVILFVGRLTAKKGIGIVNAVASSLTSASFLIAGHSPQGTVSWGTSRVINLGYLPQLRLRQIYQAADLLLLPSYSEGFPLVVQEALVEGCPVLTTEEVAAACPDAAKLLVTCPVPHCDDPTPWLNALASLLNAPEPTEVRACRASDAHRLWSWKRCTDAYAHLIEEHIWRNDGEIRSSGGRK